MLGSRVRSDDVGAMKLSGEFAAQVYLPKSQHVRGGASFKSEKNRTAWARGSSESHMYTMEKNHMQGCVPVMLLPAYGVEIWIGRAHDHAHHVCRAFTLQAFHRLTVAICSSPTSLCALRLSSPRSQAPERLHSTSLLSSR